MTAPRVYRDFEAPALLPSSGLTPANCRDMQRVVLHNFMEKRHEPVVARDILEMLGIAFRVPDTIEDYDGKTGNVIDLLWTRDTGITSQPRQWKE